MNELLPCGLRVQQDMVAALEGYEVCIRDERCDHASVLEAEGNVAATGVEDERRAANLRQQIVHVGLHERAQEPDAVVDRGGQAEQVVVGAGLLRGCIRYVKRS